MGAASTTKPRQTGYNLSVDEETTGCSRIKSSIHGNRHGNHRGSFHPGEDVDPIKHHNIDHRHPESITELGRISTSASHYSRSNCGNMCVEMTNHPTTHSMKTNNTRNNYLRQYIVKVPPLFLRDEEIFCS